MVWHFTQWWGLIKDGTLPWKLLATTVNGGQNGSEKPNFFQGDNASKISFPNGQFAWNLDTINTIRESMSPSIRSEKNCQIFSLMGHLPLPKKRLLEPCFNECLVVSLQTNWYVFESTWPLSESELQGCVCVWLFIYELPFWRYFTVKVPKIYSARHPRLRLKFRTVVVSKCCIVSSYGERNTWVACWTHKWPSQCIQKPAAKWDPQSFCF